MTDRPADPLNAWIDAYIAEHGHMPPLAWALVEDDDDDDTTTPTTGGTR